MLFLHGVGQCPGWDHFHSRFLLVAILILVGGGWVGSVRAETRRTAPIDRGEEQPAPEVRVGERQIYVPVERDLVRRAFQRLVNAWNRRRLQDVLALDFYDRERLLRVRQSGVPEDARLRLIALRDVMVLDQSLGMPHPDGSVPVTTEVLAEVLTQVTFNRQNAGPPSPFVRREGLNEYRVTLRYRLRPSPGAAGGS